jgi:SAM-dependent methyltransferase
MTETTERIYDRAAGSWARTGPVLLSDHTARPFVLAAAEPTLRGARVLDLGCGEGYVARQLAARGAASILAMDISAGMVERAREAEAREPLGIEYRVADCAAGLDLEAGAFDLAVAVFLFNYLELAAMQRVLEAVHGALRPGGRFLFTVPHPLLPFLREHEAPFYFDAAGRGYFEGRDAQFEGRIWRRDGVDVPVRCVHKTFGDYFEAMRAAGFTAMPRVTELRATAEHLELDPEFFGPLAEQPLHVLFELER